MASRRGTAHKSLFTWSSNKEAQDIRLLPSQELTRKLIRNQTVDIKVPKHNLFSMRGLPEFPNSEWTKVIQGKAINFDIILSGIHTIVTDNCAIETVGNFKLQFSHAKPTKLVKSHGDWLIMFSTFQWEMQFICPH